MKQKFSSCLRQKQIELRIIPFRYILAVIISLLEVLAVIGVVVALCYYVPYFYIAAWLTEIYCVIRIAASDDTPDYKVPWLILVLVVPIVGFMLYFLFYSRKLQRKYIRRLEELKSLSYPRDETIMTRLQSEDPKAASLARMISHIADTRLFHQTAQTYFSSGESLFERLCRDLEKAEKFIFMEYFIIEPGKFWDTILDILKKKAAEGVDVKVVYDDIGCMGTLPGNYSKTLRSYGIDATPFSRLRGNADSEFNNRSHRKITVIDGYIGYTGGINLADEYINEVVRFGHWKDTGIRLEGEAVWELTRLFLTDFGINVKQMPQIKAPLFPACKREVKGYMIPFGDGPHPIYTRRVGKSVIQGLLNGATRYVYITTPYLIMDNSMCQSLENAALRGVDVRIILPHIPDKKLIFGMSRSFYYRLMAAGVKIYEYAPGFIHAKSYLADDVCGMIGTINLDYRSLVHHFENGVWMYDCDALAALKSDMEETLEKCIPISSDLIRTTLLQRLVRSLVRIVAPLL